MSNFDNFISNIIIEATPPVPGSPTATPTSPTLSPEKLYNDLIKKADQDIKNPGTILASNGENLVKTYFITKGLQWKKKEYWGGGVQKKNLDNVAAKYVDCGQQIYKITNLSDLIEENFANISDNQEALQTIQRFITTNISQYQCSDPILKNVSEADDLAEIALSTFNNESVFGAVLKMLQQRAGKIKAVINKGTLQAMLTYPAQYASGRTAIPEPLEKTLVESSMYNERLLAIGVAAIEYFKYLVNIEVARITAENRKKRNKKTAAEQYINFNDLVNSILLTEFEVGGAQGHTRGTGGRIAQFNPELRGPGGKSLSVQQKYGQTQMLKLTPFNLFDPKTWKQDSVFEKQYMKDFVSFITSGIAQSVPQKNEKGVPIVYNIGTISQDRSTQAQELVKALQAIAQFKKTKQSLWQTFKQRLGRAAGALGALRVGMGPVG